MPLISLTQGQFAIVDAGDYEALSAFKWFAIFNPHTHSFYAKRSGPHQSGKQKGIWMARVILGAKPGEIVDHVNRDTLDNRRANLRIVTARQNSWNRRLLTTRNKSGYRGVSWYSRHKKWVAQIRVNSRRIHLGYFISPESAAAAYDRVARELHEGFTPLNFSSPAVVT